MEKAGGGGGGRGKGDEAKRGEFPRSLDRHNRQGCRRQECRQVCAEYRGVGRCAEYRGVVSRVGR